MTRYLSGVRPRLLSVAALVAFLAALGAVTPTVGQNGISLTGASAMADDDDRWGNDRWGDEWYGDDDDDDRDDDDDNDRDDWDDDDGDDGDDGDDD